jgi:hypothetical protein
MNTISKAAISAGTAVALASGIYYSTREPTREVGNLAFTEQYGKPHIAKTKSGKHVRIVMGAIAGAKEEDTDFGKAFVIPEGNVPADAFCNIVFEADIEIKNGRPQPKLDGLDRLLNAGALPVLIRIDDDDVGIWNCLFKGNSCLSMAEMPEYIGSDIQQFINHKKRKFLLKTRAITGSKDKNDRPKADVDIDDVDADPNAEVIFPHGWAGRDDLAMGTYQAGTVTSQVEKIRLEHEKIAKEKEEKGKGK